MSERNKAVFEKLMSALNAKDVATMESIIADDFVDNDAMPGMAPGKERGSCLNSVLSDAGKVLESVTRELELRISFDPEPGKPPRLKGLSWF